LLQTIISGSLVAPWAIALAPASVVEFGGPSGIPLSGISGRRVRHSHDCLSRYHHSPCPATSDLKSATMLIGNGGSSR
jgi:hypothetical protein